LFVNHILYTFAVTINVYPKSFTNMLVVTIKENESLDKALKRFKKKFEKTGVLRELRRRAAYEKPSVSRRNTVIRAAYKQALRSEDETM